MSQNNETMEEGPERLDGNRRGLLAGAGLSALAVGALSSGATVLASGPANAQGVTDADIFNFALNLEYLEAEYYLRGITGRGLRDADITGTGALGGVIGGRAVNFRSAALQQTFTKIAVDEELHVRVIRQVLGASAVARPTINFFDAFSDLALAAGLAVPGQRFDPFADEVSFLLGAFVFEDVGVTAYGGAANLISNRDLLAAAASILAVEAYHGGSVRTHVANFGGGEAADKITFLRERLSGASDEAPLRLEGSNYNIAPTDRQALTFRRTTRQVLNIVYGARNAPGGLFFPAGMNGTIRS
jgi:hypothetical protein